jgi:DMSO/TMAO reductase YedYZ molybdopterin-dependent catalytic subunit
MSATNQANDVRGALPVHGAGAAPGPDTLRVDGLVARPLTLRVADLRALPGETLVDDFTCLEGWTVPGLRWQGVRLAAVLDLAQVQPEARWVQASAGEGDETFSLPLPLPEARRAFLAYGLGGQPLAPGHGGPLRLVVPGRECFTSVKWLDRLQLQAEPGPDTARAIATRRLAK